MTSNIFLITYFFKFTLFFQERNLMSKYLYRCLQNYDRVEVEDVVFEDGRDDEGEEFDKSQNAITLSPQRRPQELVSTCVRISLYL